MLKIINNLSKKIFQFISNFKGYFNLNIPLLMNAFFNAMLSML